MSKMFRMDGEVDMLERLSRLLTIGEQLLATDEFVGETQDIRDWHREIEGVIGAQWGMGSSYWISYKEIEIFPKWYKPSIDIQTIGDTDKKAALGVFKSGIGNILSVLKSMKNDVDLIGLPNIQTAGSYPSHSQKIEVNPVFNNSQTITFSVQSLLENVNNKLNDKDISTDERSFLEQVKGGAKIAKDGLQLMSLVLSVAGQMGIPVATITKLLGL
ncbi:MAG TPA: hypothetical protein VLH94_04135 [Spirochaetia bacterium]|nr:hypothetical protein [Spirochaetia bacterium]